MYLLVDGLDGETGTQVGRSLLVGDGLVPDIHFPFVGRHIEVTGGRVVGDLLLILAAEEGRRAGYHRAFLPSPLWAGSPGRLLSSYTGRPVFEVDALRPSDLVDEGEGVEQLAIGAVEHEEEAIAVCLAPALMTLPVLGSL